MKFESGANLMSDGQNCLKETYNVHSDVLSGDELNIAAKE